MSKTPEEIASEILKDSLYENYEETMWVKKLIVDALRAERAGVLELEESLKSLFEHSEAKGKDLQDCQEKIKALEAKVASLEKENELLRHSGFFAEAEESRAEVNILKSQVQVLTEALRQMIGTHGEPCIHYPCESLNSAKEALCLGKDEK